MSAPSWRPTIVTTTMRLLRRACRPMTALLREALGPRRAHVVGGQRVEHRRAGLPHDDGGEAGAEDDGRQDHVVQVVRPGPRGTARSRTRGTGQSPPTGRGSRSGRARSSAPTGRAGRSALATHSAGRPRRTAATTPAPTPMRPRRRMASSASSSVTGSAVSSIERDRLARCGWRCPGRPGAALLTKRQYCTSSGWSRPYCSRIAAQGLRVRSSPGEGERRVARAAPGPRGRRPWWRAPA